MISDQASFPPTHQSLETFHARLTKAANQMIQYFFCFENFRREASCRRKLPKYISCPSLERIQRVAKNISREELSLYVLHERGEIFSASGSTHQSRALNLLLYNP